MIVQFEFSNFRSFRDEQTFSMLSLARNHKKRELEENLIHLDEKNSLLKSAVLYGANASGKSNFIRALDFFRAVVVNSNYYVENGSFPFDPYLFDPKYKSRPSEFEILFWIRDVYYRYGFTADQSGVKEEWLYLKKQKQSKVFHRKGQNLEDIGDSYRILKDANVKKTVHSKSLLLSRGASFNEEICAAVFSEISDTQGLSGIYDSRYYAFTVNYMKNEEKKSRVLSLLKNADLQIDDISITETEGFAYNVKIQENPSLEKTVTSVSEVKSVRILENGEKIELPFPLNESEGTQKFFHLSGPILDTLEKGSVLIIDELDTKLHPLLTRKIIELFHNKETNPKNAQIIFATHDTNLLDKELFRRDQVWFAEKDITGASQIYPLSDFKIRNDISLEKNYISGKYGAIPYLQNLSSLLGQNC